MDYLDALTEATALAQAATDPHDPAIGLAAAVATRGWLTLTGADLCWGWIGLDLLTAMADIDQPIPLASPDVSAPTADTPRLRAGVDALLTAVGVVFAAAARDQARPEAQRGAYAVAAAMIGQATGRLR